MNHEGPNRRAKWHEAEEHEEASRKKAPRSHLIQKRTEAEREAARERLGGAFITRAWHSDGTEYTDAEYEAAGIEPPSSDQREWLNLPLEERLARIDREAATVTEDEDNE